MWYIVITCFIVVSLLYFCRKSYKNNLKLRIYYYFFIFLTSFVILTIVWPYLLLTPKNPKNLKFCGRIIRYMAKYTNIKWELRNGNILAENKASIVVANHQSLLDNVGMLIVWDVADTMYAVSKKEVFFYWPIGLTFYICGVIFIDRKNPIEAFDKMKSIVNKLSAAKAKLWIFPEGTRNEDVNKLLPFKTGAFAAAVEAQLPIIPIVISPYHFFTKGKESLLLRGPIVYECLDPEPTEGLTMADVATLTKRIQKRMEAKYKELSEEVLDYYNFYCDSEYSNGPVLTIKNKIVKQ